MLRQGPQAKPLVKRAVIVCPSSLVRNWANELKKWLANRVSCLVVEGGTKAQISADLGLLGWGCGFVVVAEAALEEKGV